MHDFQHIAKEVLELEATELLRAATLIGDEMAQATHLMAKVV